MKTAQTFGLLTLAALLGCQAQPAVAPQASVPMPLPSAFSQSYQIAFQKNPKMTAQRFLRAFDNFAEHGPVTTQTVQDHARLQMSLERGQVYGGILAVDLNADGLITRVEYETLSGLPNGAKKSNRMAGLFEFDENHDDLMTLEEAVRFGQELYAVRSKKGLRPIESYLMLFDLNGDGQVVRGEMERALHIHLSKSEPAASGLRARRITP